MNEKVTNLEIETLHAAGLKATFVERLRNNELGTGDSKLAAAHLARLAEALREARAKVDAILVAAKKVVDEIEEADDGDLVLEQVPSVDALAAAILEARA